MPLQVEPEVEAWLRALPDREFGQAAFHVDLLAGRGGALGFPYSSQLSLRLRELRFFTGGRATRITYFLSAPGRIVLLTVFPGRKPANQPKSPVRSGQWSGASMSNTTPMRTDWQSLRDERIAGPEARDGYERARRAFEVGEQVRELRTRRGLTQAQLAAKVGTSQAAIARLEAGGVEPRMSTLDAVARALGATLTVRVA